MTDHNFDVHKSSEAELVELFEKTAVFTPLKAVQMPSATDLSADRQVFLNQVVNYQQRSAIALPAPIPSIGIRLQNWLMHILSWNSFFKKEEKHTMTSLFVKMAVIIIAVVGVAGTTAVAANDSLPDTPLYTIKLAIENTELALTADESSQAELHMRFAQTRIDEIEQLAIENHIANDEQLARLQTHLETTLQLMATMPEGNMNGILLRAQQMAQTNTRSMTQAQSNAPEAVQSQLGDAYQLMHQFGQEVEQGLADPVLFRQRHTNNRPDTAPEQPNNEPFEPNRPITPTQQLSPGPNNCLNEDCDPLGNAQQQQGQPDVTPAAGNCADGEVCEPINNENQYGNTEEDPSYGNRNDTEDEPAGNMDQNQQQPTPNSSNPSQPDSGNTACPNGDCNNRPDSLEKNQYSPGSYGSDPSQPGSGDTRPHGSGSSS